MGGHGLGGRLSLGHSPISVRIAFCLLLQVLSGRRIVRYVIWLIAAIGCGVAGQATAAEGRRAALVIGNGAYVHATALPNPANDATAVPAALQRIGFEQVVLLNDLGADALRRALIEFEPKAAGADIALVYFAGH
jgi:hypothetical protein